jgi:hypothetical protein
MLEALLRENKKLGRASSNDPKPYLLLALYALLSPRRLWRIIPVCRVKPHNVLLRHFYTHLGVCKPSDHSLVVGSLQSLAGSRSKMNVIDRAVKALKLPNSGPEPADHLWI